MLESVELSASGLSESGVPWATAKGPPVGEGDDAPDYGKTPVAFGLGIAARPYRKNEKGFAVGFVAEATGYDGILVGGFDSRSAATYGNLKEGETALFATGEDYDSRVLLGDRLASIIVSDDIIIQLDGKKKQVVINTPGGSIKASKKDGVVLVDETGKGMIQIKGGNVSIPCGVVLGGRNPVGMVADSLKVMAELVKIKADLTAIATFAGTSSTYIPATTGVGASGVFYGK